MYDITKVAVNPSINAEINNVISSVSSLISGPSHATKYRLDPMM